MLVKWCLEEGHSLRGTPDPLDLLSISLRAPPPWLDPGAWLDAGAPGAKRASSSPDGSV